MRLMSSKDLQEAMGAKNTKQALARAMRKDAAAARALDAHSAAVLELKRAQEAKASPAALRELHARMEAAEAARLVEENRVRAAWGIPAREG